MGILGDIGNVLSLPGQAIEPGVKKFVDWMGEDPGREKLEIG